MYFNLAEILLNSVPVLPSSASLAESSGFLQDSCRTPASPAGIGGGLESTTFEGRLLCMGMLVEGVDEEEKGEGLLLSLKVTLMPIFDLVDFEAGGKGRGRMYDLSIFV